MLELVFIAGGIVGYCLRYYQVKKQYERELEHRAPKVKNPKTKK